MEKIEKNNKDLEKSGGAVGSNAEQKEKDSVIEGLEKGKNTRHQSNVSRFVELAPWYKTHKNSGH